MGKPTICIGENKDADQLRGTAKLISAFVFATRIVQFLFHLNPKFQVSSLLLCLYRPVCIGPVRKPHCWFSHEVAHMFGSLTFKQRFNMSHLVGKPTMWFPNRSDTNRPVQAQKIARSLKFRRIVLSEMRKQRR